MNIQKVFSESINITINKIEGTKITSEFIEKAFKKAIKLGLEENGEGEHRSLRF